MKDSIRYLNHYWVAVFVCVACLHLLTGCTTTESVRSATRPATINHIVFFVLHDPADRAAVIADCDRLLATIPSVTSYFCGEHLDTGRATVDSAYDVGLYVGFDSLDGYAQYVDHPQHIELVTTWRPKLKQLVVRDVWDDTP